jgi:hypothetical protein
MIDTVREFVEDNYRPLAWIFGMLLACVIIVYILQHTEFATVTGPVTAAYHTEAYYTTEWTETCATVGKTKTCTWGSKNNYHPATWTIRMFANDKTWDCSVDERTYNEAIRTKWATAFCMTWNE